jgi:fatty-acyl-CoA synthase
MTTTPAAPYVDLLMERLAAQGTDIVLRYQRCDISAAELRASIHRYTRALAGLGVGRGDLVALFAANSPDAIAIRYATHLAGAAAVYLPVLPEPRRRAGVVAQMDPQLLVVFPETANLLDPALLPTGFTVPVAAVGEDPAAASLALVPLARVPRTEQGKPDRPAIRALGREAASTSQTPPGRLDLVREASPNAPR